MLIKELTELERLKLSLDYSISEKHQKSLIERIKKLEEKPIQKIKSKKEKIVAEQISFL